MTKINYKDNILINKPYLYYKTKLPTQNETHPKHTPLTTFDKGLVRF